MLGLFTASMNYNVITFSLYYNVKQIYCNFFPKDLLLSFSKYCIVIVFSNIIFKMNNKSVYMFIWNCEESRDFWWYEIFSSDNILNRLFFSFFFVSYLFWFSINHIALDVNRWNFVISMLIYIIGNQCNGTV